MSISKIAQSIKEPATLRLTKEANRLKANGEPVIHLGSGEPKSKVPIDAIRSCIAKLETAEVRYTPTEGIPSLLEAIRKYTGDNYKQDVDAENIITTTGAKQSFYTLMMTILDPNDEVIIFSPYWVSYPDIVRICQGKPVIIGPMDGSFIPAMSDIKESVNSKTKAIVLNSPNNPSGAVYPEELIQEIVEFCEKKQIYLVMDDIYHKLVFDKVTVANCYDYTSIDFEESRLVVLNGISKLYAMTGFRIGWAVGNRKLIRAMINMASQNFSCPSAINQAAAVGALNGDQSVVESLRAQLENNRNVMTDALATIKGVKLVAPKGTFYCLPDFSFYNKSSQALAEMLLKQALVVTIPGIEFGMEGHLRLSVCGSPEEIKEGVARIRWLVDPDSPNEISIGERRMTRDRL